MKDKAYWSQVNRYRRNAKTFGRYPKEIPRGVAKLPNLGPIAERPERELELPYCHTPYIQTVNTPAKALQIAPNRSKQPLKVGTRAFVSNEEHRYRHWCDRVLDEQGTCDYCDCNENLTAVPNPGVSMEDATMETICAICPSCIQDHLEMENAVLVNPAS